MRVFKEMFYVPYNGIDVSCRRIFGKKVQCHRYYYSFQDCFPFTVIK